MLRLQYGGGGEMTRIVCGFLSCDRQLVSPLLGALPPLFRVHAGDGAAAAWITSSLAFTLAEETAAVAGSAHTLAKLSELMFAEAIKLYLRSLPPQESGWLAGLRDRFVGRALALIHGDPARQWTVEELGRQVGLSRSALAQRFTDFLGEPPMHYLSGWRLRMAAQLLVSDNRRVGAVAETVGYDSEAAFNRAFKRQFGMPPSMWRRNAHEPRDRRAQRKPARSSV